MNKSNRKKIIVLLFLVAGDIAWTTMMLMPSEEARLDNPLVWICFLGFVFAIWGVLQLLKFIPEKKKRMEIEQ